MAIKGIPSYLQEGFGQAPRSLEEGYRPTPPTTSKRELLAQVGLGYMGRGTSERARRLVTSSLYPHDRRGWLASARCPLTLCACVQVMTLRKRCLKGRMGSPGQAKPCLVTKPDQDRTPNTWHKELASGKRWASPGAVPQWEMI